MCSFEQASDVITAVSLRFSYKIHDGFLLFSFCFGLVWFVVFFGGEGDGWFACLFVFGFVFVLFKTQLGQVLHIHGTRKHLLTCSKALLSFSILGVRKATWWKTPWMPRNVAKLCVTQTELISNVRNVGSLSFCFSSQGGWKIMTGKCCNKSCLQHGQKRIDTLLCSSK